MSRLAGRFPHPHAVLPVIHVESLDQAMRNAEIAHAAGCDGAFLINHGMPAGDLLEIHHAVYAAFPHWWIGVNCLGVRPEAVFSMVSNEVAGIWTDTMGIDERASSQTEAEAAARAREASGWRGLYFGGVAFKYQREVDDLESAARLAARYADVITTSGPGTGQAASREKIVRLRSALGGTPLAIASGITPENVGEYLDVADCFVVATGISRGWTELDPERVRELVDVVRNYDRRSPERPTERAAEGSTTQEFVFETDSLEALERVLTASVPLLFRRGDEGLLLQIGGAHGPEPVSYPSRTAAYFLGPRDPREAKIHRYLCSISSERRDQSDRRFASSGEAVRAAVQLARQSGGGAGDGREPFGRGDGITASGYRAQWSTSIGDRLDIFGCNIYFGK